MNVEAFKAAYHESRNGANQFFRHGLVRSFVFSDGVNECAQAGCMWLVDIAATEVPKVLNEKDESLGCLVANVRGGGAVLRLTGSGDVVLWTKRVPYTDMPDGDWTFYIADESDKRVMILPSEY